MTCLQTLKEQIEAMPTHNHIAVLRILNMYGKEADNVCMNENKNGTFVNLSVLSENVIQALDRYVSYVLMQQDDLVQVEHAKEQLEQQFFLTPSTTARSVANTPLFKNVQKQDKAKKVAP
jgi:hypothetical protein